MLNKLKDSFTEVCRIIGVLGTIICIVAIVYDSLAWNFQPILIALTLVILTVCLIFLFIGYIGELIKFRTWLVKGQSS